MANELNITSAQYLAADGENYGIAATIEGEQWNVPIKAGNAHYDEIMRQVEAGTLTIQDAD